MKIKNCLHKLLVIITAPLLSGSAVNSAEFNSDRSFYNHNEDYDTYYDRSYNFDEDNCCSNSSFLDGDFHFAADLLYWRACDPNIFVGTVAGDDIIGTDLTVEREVIGLHFNWNTGYRLSAGYSFGESCYIVDATYTHLTSTGRGNTTDTLVSADIFETPFTPFPFGDPFDAEASWKTRLNLLDIALHKNVCWSECLTFTPHVGIRAAWIKQSYHEEVNGTIQAINFISDEIDLNSNYSGVGARAGFDLNFDISCGFSIYGTAAFSIMAGNFTIESDLLDIFGIGSTTPLTLESHFRDNYCACTAISDLGLGLRWKKEFEYDCSCSDCVIQIGWEQHNFFNHARLQGNGFERIRNDDLCFEGLTLSIGVDF